MQIQGNNSVRENLMQTTAKKTVKSNSGASMAEILAKMQSGDISAKTSSSAAIVKKMNSSSKSSAETASKVLGNSDFGTKSAVADKVARFLEKVSALAATDEKSLFIMSAATTKEAEEAFDLKCTANGTPFTMEVKQLAQSQLNKGDTFYLDEATDLSIGRKYFDLTVDGETESLVVKVNADDTTGSVINKVVSAINDANLAVTASLVEDGQGKGHIEIESNGTGAPIEKEVDVFHFTNLSEDNLVTKFGLGNMSRAGVDAIFNFNNAEEDTTYMYNSALVNSTTSVDFKKVTDGPVQVSFDYDFDKLSNTIEDYVNAYNDLLKTSKDSGIKAVENYFSQVQDVAEDMEEELKSIGITIEHSGKMHYNSGQLYLTDMAEIKATLNRATTGYSAKVSKVAKSLEGYMDRLTGKTKKYYGLKAKKRNTGLRQMLSEQ